jgi:hypothetical protein
MTLSSALPAHKRHPPQVLPVEPEQVERGVVQVPPAGEETTEVLPSLRIQRHDLAIENDLFDPELVPNPVEQLVKLLEDIAAL